MLSGRCPLRRLERTGEQRKIKGFNAESQRTQRTQIIGEMIF
jgi:hypothetical protein